MLELLCLQGLGFVVGLLPTPLKSICHKSHESNVFFLFCFCKLSFFYLLVSKQTRKKVDLCNAIRGATMITFSISEIWTISKVQSAIVDPYHPWGLLNPLKGGTNRVIFLCLSDPFCIFILTEWGI